VPVRELIAYQDAAYARRYVEDVLRVVASPRERAGAEGAANSRELRVAGRRRHPVDLGSDAIGHRFRHRRQRRREEC
jgi:hypothetical protein